MCLKSRPVARTRERDPRSAQRQGEKASSLLQYARDALAGNSRPLYIYIYIYIHTHIHTYMCISLSLSIYIYIYLYIFIEREREGERLHVKATRARAPRAGPFQCGSETSRGVSGSIYLSIYPSIYGFGQRARGGARQGGGGPARRTSYQRWPGGSGNSRQTGCRARTKVVLVEVVF